MKRLNKETVVCNIIAALIIVAILGAMVALSIALASISANAGTSESAICWSTASDSDAEVADLGFTTILDEAPVHLMYQDVTGVMYVTYSTTMSKYRRTGMSVLLNADGTPMIYDEYTDYSDFEMVVVETDYTYIVMYDKATSVMYCLYGKSSGRTGSTTGLTPLYDSDGLPYLYSEMADE